MKLKISLIIFTVFVLYGGVTYYIGIRGWLFLKYAGGFNHFYSYWSIYLYISLAMILSRLPIPFMPKIIRRFTSKIGLYWIGGIIFILIPLVFIDGFLFLNRFYPIIPISILKNSNTVLVLGSGLLIFIGVLFLFGRLQAAHISSLDYKIITHKQAGDLSSLKIALISDLHLGDLVNHKQLKKIVDKVNGEQPDLICITGDIIDDSIESFQDQNMGETLQLLKAKYGIFAVPGNHDYFGGDIGELEKELSRAGIQLLRDKTVLVANRFYIVGREDHAGQRFLKKKRLELGELLSNVDKSLPIILLDHQPTQLKEAEMLGVDLQLSGHTHKGQFAPYHLVTRKVFEIDWGHLKKGNFHVIVTSGIGTWGPPIRIGTQSELVNIQFQFNKS